MRILKKGTAPSILIEKAAAWKDELVATLARGEKPSETIKQRYRHKDIKNALLAETAGKCAYCESKIRHIAHGDIEHIIPKSKVPEKAYDWDNLTIACDMCNENKGDYFNADSAQTHEDLVDPYIDDPKEHFLFLREILHPRPDSMRGYKTNYIIKLSRSELLEHRRERMDFLDGLVRAYQNADAQYKELLLSDLYMNHLKESDEYSASSNAYIEYLKQIGAL